MVNYREGMLFRLSRNFVNIKKIVVTNDETNIHLDYPEETNEIGGAMFIINLQKNNQSDIFHKYFTPNNIINMLTTLGKVL